MRNQLLFKMLGAFLLVIAIGAAVIALLVSRATQSAFYIYSTRSGQAWAQRLAPLLEDFYASNGSWKGVDAFLQSDAIAAGGPGMMSRTPGTGSGMMGQGRGYGAGQAASGGMMNSMGQRVILLDGQGTVVSDSQGDWSGKQIPAAQASDGTPITVNGGLVGTLIVTPNDATISGTPASEFLSSVNQAIVSSALVAGVIALALGAGLFFQITAPLRQLTKAAAAIAGGDLKQRVTIQSKDEFGTLGKTFNHMAESLSAAETQRQHLVADVAHELRTPLAAIQATLEGVQDGVLPLDEEQVSALYAETILLNRLVGDLRLLSLAEAGQLKLERQEISPVDLLQAAAERNRPQANQKKVNLLVELPADLPPVWVDADRIQQVMNNLIGNALRYTPEGGEIRISAARAAGSAPGLRISVSDTGPGIAAEDLPFVFDRFYRADKSRTRSSGGSGLGLAIVKQLVEAHGGAIAAESPTCAAGGTRMIFTLPVDTRDH
jgi:signal transduction histidine kinase